MRDRAVEFYILHTKKTWVSDVIRACIFDLDGVIVDTAHYHYLAWKRLANELGYHLSEADNEQLKGVSRMQSLDVVLKLAGISLNVDHRIILANKKNTWFNEYIEQMKPEEIFPGVLDLIHSIKAENIKVGLASSSKNARTVLRLLHIEHEFDAVVDGNMISRTKPDPEIFIMAAQRLGVANSECIVIEDAEAGVQAALAAGMKCIGIGSKERLHRANVVLSKTSDIKLSTLRELASVSG